MAGLDAGSGFGFPAVLVRVSFAHAMGMRQHVAPAACSFWRWWNAWYILAVTERDFTALMDAFTGAHLVSQLSLVSVSAVSLVALKFGQQFSHAVEAVLQSRRVRGSLHLQS